MEELKKYEVAISVRLHGTFTVLAKDESCAEEILNAKFANDEIKLAELEFADETLVDCVGESDANSKAINDGEAANGGETESGK